MDKILGVNAFIFIYFIFSVIAFCSVMIYIKREKIRRTYYKIRFPEKIIKCVVHYTSTYYKEYWRIIPDDNKYNMEGKQYLHSESEIVKKNDIFAVLSDKEEETYKVSIEGKKYDILKKYKIKTRGRSYPEIHFFFNNPKPIMFDFPKKKIDLTSKQMKEFEENDLFSKLLTLATERSMLTFLIIMGVGNLLLSIAIFGKLMEWF